MRKRKHKRPAASSAPHSARAREEPAPAAASSSKKQQTANSKQRQRASEMESSATEPAPITVTINTHDASWFSWIQMGISVVLFTVSFLLQSVIHPSFVETKRDATGSADIWFTCKYVLTNVYIHLSIMYMSIYLVRGYCLWGNEHANGDDEVVEATYPKVGLFDTPINRTVAAWVMFYLVVTFGFTMSGGYEGFRSGASLGLGGPPMLAFWLLGRMWCPSRGADIQWFFVRYIAGSIVFLYLPILCIPPLLKVLSP
jgi:hypothetical protein